MKAVILAGGSGTRLWPLSRAHKPKQFHSLLSAKTMLQETIERLSFLKPKDIYIATNQEYADFVNEQIKTVPAENIIIEPALRDTASCIGLAATIIAKDSSKDEVMCVIYADHQIKNRAEFEKKLKFAAQIALQENSINIIEVNAKYPNPHLGYVKIGKLLQQTPRGEVYSLEQFVEKPDLKTAQKMMESYKYLWNTGLYVWKIDTIMQQFKTHLPKTAKILEKIAKALKTNLEAKVIQDEYPKCQKISIDYAIMEKIDVSLVRIIPAELGWSDIGTWEALHKELAKTTTQNVSKGSHISLDTKGCVLYNYDDRLIATIGLRNTVVINTKDALLICHKNRSQDVKKLVEELKKKGKKELL